METKEASSSDQFRQAVLQLICDDRRAREEASSVTGFDRFLKSVNDLVKNSGVDVVMNLLPVLRTSSSEGHVYSQFYLGCYYHQRARLPEVMQNAEHMLTDKKLTVAYFTLAAHQGFAEAQYNLAVFYDKGDGVDKDHKKAAEWYRRAADQGHAAAQNGLARCYLTGQGTDGVNEKKAVELLKASEKQNDPDALYNLGICYVQGWGVEIDEAHALDLFRRAAKRGHAVALDLVLKHVQEQKRRKLLEKKNSKGDDEMT